MNGSDDECWLVWLLQFASCEALLRLKEDRKVDELARKTLFTSPSSN